MDKPLMVILAIDERIDDITRCIESIRAQYDDSVDIALATYGGASLAVQPGIIEYAGKNNLDYHIPERQTWLTPEDSKEWHCSEMFARIQITRHYAKTYKEIYIMHSDVVFVGDAMGVFNKHSLKREQWSFIGATIYTKEPFETLRDRGGWGIFFDRNRARFADVVTRYNVDFVNHLYDKYGQSDIELWNNFLRQFTLWGDLSTFDLARNIDGFEGIAVEEPGVNENKMFHGTISHRPRNNFPAHVAEITIKRKDHEDIIKNRERRIHGIVDKIAG